MPVLRVEDPVGIADAHAGHRGRLAPRSARRGRSRRRVRGRRLSVSPLRDFARSSAPARHLAHHLGRLLVLAQALEGRVAQPAVVRPLGERDLAPPAPARPSATPRASQPRGGSANGRRRSLERLAARLSSSSERVVEAGADLADVAQLAVRRRPRGAARRSPSREPSRIGPADDHELLALQALDLEPVAAARRRGRRRPPRLETIPSSPCSQACRRTRAALALDVIARSARPRPPRRPPRAARAAPPCAPRAARRRGRSRRGRAGRRRSRSSRSSGPRRGRSAAPGSRSARPRRATPPRRRATPCRPAAAADAATRPEAVGPVVLVAGEQAAPARPRAAQRAR